MAVCCYRMFCSHLINHVKHATWILKQILVKSVRHEPHIAKILSSIGSYVPIVKVTHLSLKLLEQNMQAQYEISYSHYAGSIVLRKSITMCKFVFANYVV